MADTDDIAGAVSRLIKGIEPQKHRDILMRCLSGDVSPGVALMHLLADTDAAAVRKTVDEVTTRAAVLSRSGDSLLRDRVDELTQLMVETELGRPIQLAEASRLRKPR